MRTLLVAALLALLDPQPAPIQMDLRAAQKSAGGEVDLVFFDPHDGSEVLRHRAVFPWRGQWNPGRPVHGLRLEIEAAAFWAAPRLLDAEEEKDPVVMDLFPRSELVFTEARDPRTGGDSTLEGPIALDVVSAPGQRDAAQIGKARLSCRQTGGRWRCPAPAQILDVRIEKNGHIPRYFFGAKLEPGRALDLGEIRFDRGASISGFVTVEEGEPKGSTVVLNASGSDDAREGLRGELRRLEALANERGFFQLLGVAPGGYRLEASRQGLAAAEVWPVDVLEGRETSLGEPIFLSAAAELEVHLAPALGPLGKPWEVSLHRFRQDSAASVEAFEGAVDGQGTWTRKDLRPGSYFLDVHNPDGERTGAGEDSIWLSLNLDVTPGRQNLFLDIPVIAVEGTLRAGDEPVRARLIFGGFHGAPNVAIWSDEEGFFEGQLPKAGEWSLDAEVGGHLITLESVEVKPRGGRPARLDIELADTRFHGRVLHQGKPVEGAVIWGQSFASGRTGRFDTTTDAEGRFDLKGLAPGAYEITASSPRLRLGSPKLRFDIEEGSGGPAVEIELEEFLRIDGQVLGNGQPLPKAGFGALLEARLGSDTRVGQCNSAGVFGLQVPESTRSISLVVGAAGFAWQLVPLHREITGAHFSPVLVEVAQNGGTLRLQGEHLLETRVRYGDAELPLYLVRSTVQAAGYFQELPGQVQISNAAPGVYQVCLKEKCRAGVLAAGGSLDFSLTTDDGP